ncbi:MAG: hypothetical protein ACODAA_08175 [Gemmatimonadota bacterium]
MTAFVGRTELAEHTWVAGIPKRAERERVTVLVSTANENVSAAYGECARALDRRTPGAHGPPVADVDDRELRVVGTPYVTLVDGVQGVAVGDAGEARRWLELVADVAIDVPGDEPGCTEGGVPAVVAEYTFVEVGRPDDPVRRALEILDPIAFFGAELPEGEPARIPYVLRYATSSLEVLDLPA